MYFCVGTLMDLLESKYEGSGVEGSLYLFTSVSPFYERFFSTSIDRLVFLINVERQVR